MKINGEIEGTNNDEESTTTTMTAYVGCIMKIKLLYQKYLEETSCKTIPKKSTISPGATTQMLANSQTILKDKESGVV